jgi:hypothetical protein
MMIVLLGTRTVFYIVYRFINFKLSDESIDNDHLIFIYIEEIVFNVIVCYNLVGKREHDQQFED